ncbi:hypothetical protein VTJ83DRAFT_5729 [Remersonia thermophila]|uniref:Uncharacterized protein n=1 Tax=Remersonia thermophila TaxID=72144 RepID=A0ABR4D7P0_9PEZI
MPAQIRIVVNHPAVLGGNPLATGPLGALGWLKPGAAASAASAQPPRSRRGDLAMLRAGVDIAVEYFNLDGDAALPELKARARNWADRYFKGYPYAAKRPTSLLARFPNLFNLNVKPPLRLVPRMPKPSPSEPEGANPRELRRAERKAMNSEAFPEFAEPTLASDAEIDEVVHLHTQRKPAAKPVMRVDAAMLRGSGLLDTLPEFLGQLARANLETETKLATDPEAVRVELDDDEADTQPHIEMNVYAGLLKQQRRKKNRDIVLPGNLAVQSPLKATKTDGPRDNDSNNDNNSSSSSCGSEAEDSGDETDASTSTTASLRANLKKRKAAELEDSDDDDGDDDESDRSRSGSPPNKIRLHVHHPSPTISFYDMKRGRMVTRRNKDVREEDPFQAFQKVRAAAAAAPVVNERPTTSGSNTSSVSNKSASPRSSPVPITKIRVPSRSPDGSRSASPDRIIVLRHPVISRSPSLSSTQNSDSEGEAAPAASASPKTKIKIVRRERRDAGETKLIKEVD